MLRIFQLSEIKHKTQCVNYIGDGGNKTFPELNKNNTQGKDVKVNKPECMGHVHGKQIMKVENQYAWKRNKR